MRITVGLSTAGRPEGYARTIEELRRALSGHEVLVCVVQDGGDRYVQDVSGPGFTVKSTWQGNKGKHLYWETVNTVLAGCSSFHGDYHLHLPDDLLYTGGWWPVLEWKMLSMDGPFAVNILPDHRASCWGRTHFIDGAFAADRAAMEAIGWRVLPIRKTRWIRRPSLGSGVWRQVTRRLGGIVKPRLDLPITHDWSAQRSMMNPDRQWA
jgi:hypothetical protein